MKNSQQNQNDKPRNDKDGNTGYKLVEKLLTVIASLPSIIGWFVPDIPFIVKVIITGTAFQCVLLVYMLRDSASRKKLLVLFSVTIIIAIVYICLLPVALKPENNSISVLSDKTTVIEEEDGELLVESTSTLKPELNGYDGNINDLATKKERCYFETAEAKSELCDQKGNLFQAKNVIRDTEGQPWIEDAPGGDGGIGEYLILKFNETQKIDYLALKLGWTAYYLSYARPTKLKIEVEDGSSWECCFEDTEEEQCVQFTSPVQTSFVKLTILEIKTGKGENEYTTCISSVKAYMNP